SPQTAGSVARHFARPADTPAPRKLPADANRRPDSGLLHAPTLQNHTQIPESTRDVPAKMLDAREKSMRSMSKTDRYPQSAQRLHRTRRYAPETARESSIAVRFHPWCSLDNL